MKLVNNYKNKPQYFNLIKKKKYSNKAGMNRCFIFSEK